ncbi:MAG: response regulator [Thermoanaerobaculia bacterium]|nr:response regulator [Thermoanaerobaculia bacterium]
MRDSDPAQNWSSRGVRPLHATLWLLGWLTTSAVGMATGPLPAPTLQATAWGVAEGLPGTHVNQIVQDDVGFLWIGTLTGLVRFDGLEFEQLDDPEGILTGSRITALHFGASGTLWIGTEQGHLIAYRGREFERISDPPYPRSRIASLVEDADGTLWASRYTDPLNPGHALVWQLVEDELVPRKDLDLFWVKDTAKNEAAVLTYDGDAIPLAADAMAVVYLSQDTDGNAWGQIRRGRQVRLRDGNTGPPGEPFERAFAISGRTVFARLLGERVEVYDEAMVHIGSFPRQNRRPLLVDRRGRIWLVDGEDRIHLQRAEDSVELATLEVGTHIKYATEDREGNVWLGTTTRGVVRVSESPLRSWGLEQGVPLPASVGIFADGEVFVEPAPRLPGQSLYRLDGAVIDGARSWLMTDRRGRSWTFGGPGANRVPNPSSFHRLDMDGTWITEDPVDDGILWVASERSLQRVDARLAEGPRVTGDWPLAVNPALASDGDGGLWIGTADGLYRLRQDRLERFGKAEGLPVENVRAIHPDGKNGLWLGTYGGGLVHYDGKSFTAISTNQGLPEAVVSSIVADRFGAYWLAGNRGIHRVRSSDLEALVSGESDHLQVLSFGRDDGLANPETTGRPAVAGPDGRLWFSTFGGVIAVDPSAVARRERFLPEVVITEVHSSQEGSRPGPRITIPRRATRDLGFAFSAIHLTAPELLSFRYRLEPLDKEWILGTGRRIATYRDPPPGDYRFQVQARHSGKAWSEAVAEQRVIVLPRFRETWAFDLLLAVLALATIGIGWSLSTRQLRRRSRLLELAVRKRTAALATERDVVKRQAIRLGDLAESRSRFMAGISHELRTPLTLILGPLKDLSEDRLGRLPAAASEEVSTTLRNAERLHRLVDRLLGAARSEAELTRLHCREHDLAVFLQRLVEELQPLAERRSTTLRVIPPEGPCPVWFDELQLESVVINLIANAIKHTPQGSTVEVSLGVSEGDDGDVLLEVRDDGPGIPASEVPQLFERFYRGRASSQNSEGGFGLGLSLVREVVERHGGSIELTTGDEGTSFVVRLRQGRDHIQDGDLAPFDRHGAPLQKPSLILDDESSGSPLSVLPEASAATQASDGEGPGEERTTVLIVDDHPDLRRLVRRQLHPRYQVLEASDGSQALSMIEDELPDLVLSDVMMPGLDGYELCRAVRKNPETDFIPIVLLTARASPESRVEGLEQGADAYLAKPFHGDVLRATVAGLISSRQRLRDRFADLYSAGPTQPGPTQSGPTQSGAVEDASSPGQALSAEEKTVGPTDRDYLRRVGHAIETHLHEEDFNVDKLATLVFQSRVSLYRHLKRLLRVSASDLIREARLERAHRLLSQQEGTVNEVAYAVGFKSTAHFSNCFRERYQVRPSKVLHDDTTIETADAI